MKLAFVGCGNCLTVSFGPVLSFVRDVEIVAAVDPCDSALAVAKDRYGISSGYHTLEECLESESVDAALIASPVYLHEELAVLCAQRGVHVLLEKPMAPTLSACDSIIAAHASAGTTLMVAFMKRFNRSMLAVETLMREGAIGEVMGVRHNWDWGEANNPSSRNTGGDGLKLSGDSGRITDRTVWTLPTGGRAPCVPLWQPLI